MTVRLAIFDCDGTLIDGQASICEAMEAAFAASGNPAPARNDIRRVVGLSLGVAVQRLLPEGDNATHRAIVESYKQEFRSARSRGAIRQPLIPGIVEVLQALRDEGWQLAVATGMSDRGLTHCLATNEITDLFASLQTADRHPSKPDPSMLNEALFETAAEPESAVMIGDTAFDMQAGVAAGVRAIGVNWGYHTPDELRAAGADLVVETPAQLKEHLLS